MQRTNIHFTGRGFAMIALAVVSANVFAQAMPEVVKPTEVRKSAPAVVSDTTRVFPQINAAIGERAVRPENPRTPVAFTEGPLSNLLVAGSVAGESRVSSNAKFPGISALGSFPPDPDIAVGPTHIVQVVNGAVAFFDKSGNKVFQQSDSPSGFWSGLGATSFIFDPKAFYDPISQRFVIIELEAQFSSNVSKLLVAVSDDNNPNGNWFKYRLEAKITRNGSEFWFDYPGWGFNKDLVVTSGNYFGFTAGGFHSVSVAIDKAPMLTGAATTTTFFDNPDATVQVARTADANQASVYGNARGSSGSASKIYAWTKVGSAVTMANVPVTVPNWTGFGGNAVTLGGQQNDTLGDRMMTSYIRNGRLFATHTTRVTASKSQVTWYEFSVGNWPASGVPTLVQSGNITPPDGEFYYVPAVAQNRLGDVSVLFTRSSASIAADVMVASRKASDPTGQMGTPTMVASSAGRAPASYGTRFGDYADVEIDPTDNLRFWGVANTFSASNQWTTEIPTWTVSTDAGGGGGAGGLLPNAATVWFGTAGGGDVDSAKTSDDVYYSVNSLQSRKTAAMSAAEFTFTTTDPASVLTSLTVSVEAIVSGGGNPGGTLFLFNHRTGRWDLYKNWNLATSGNALQSITISRNFSDYVNAGRLVRVLMRGYETGTRYRPTPAAHQLRVDRIFVQTS